MSFVKRGSLILVFSFACCAGLSAPDKKPDPPKAAPAATPTPAAKEILVMSVEMGKRWEILRMMPDGGCPQFLDQKKGFSSVAPTANQGDDFAPSASADGKLLAFYSNRSGAVNLWICDADGGQQRQVTDSEASLVSLDDPLSAPIQFSPDSKKLLFLSQGNLWIENLATQELSTLEGRSGIQAFVIAADGKSVFYYRQGSIFKLNISGQPDELLISNGGNWPTLGSTADGSVIYFYKGIWVYDARMRQKTSMVSSPILPNTISSGKDGLVAYVGLSPDQRPEIYLLSLTKKDAAGKHPENTMLTQGGGSNPFFSADGKTVYFQRKGSLYSIGSDGSNVKLLEVLPCFLPSRTQLSFSPAPECAKP